MISYLTFEIISVIIIRRCIIDKKALPKIKNYSRLSICGAMFILILSYLSSFDILNILKLYYIFISISVLLIINLPAQIIIEKNKKQEE